MANLEKIYPIVVIFATGSDGHIAYREITPEDYDNLPSNFKGTVFTNLSAHQLLEYLGTTQTEHRMTPQKN